MGRTVVAYCSQGKAQSSQRCTPSWNTMLTLWVALMIPEIKKIYMNHLSGEYLVKKISITGGHKKLMTFAQPETK